MEKYQDLMRAGMTRAELAGRVRRGELVRIRRGAFRPPQSLTPEQNHLELIAAMASGLPTGGVLSHATAAVLHELPVPASALDRLHIITPGKSGRLSKHLHRHTGAVPEAESAGVELRGSAVVAPLAAGAGLAGPSGRQARKLAWVPVGFDAASGLRITSRARTVVDLARSLAYADAVAVVDAALRAGAERAELEAELELARRRPGNARAGWP